MPLLVDTTNVLHVTGVLPAELAGLDESGLAELIARSRWRHERVLLAVDGGAPGDHRPFQALAIVLRSCGSRSADAVIIEEAMRSSFARRLIVVSNDRALVASTNRLGCRSMSSDDFLAALAQDALRPPRDRDLRQPHRPRTPLNAESVDAWLREFGVDPTTPPEQARA